MDFRGFIQCLQTNSLIVPQTTPNAFQLTTPYSPECSTILSDLVVSSLIIHKYRVSRWWASGIKNLFLISVQNTEVRFASLQKKSQSFFLINIHPRKLRCGSLWWHDKFPDNTRLPSTCFDVCFGLPQPQRSLCGFSSVEDGCFWLRRRGSSQNSTG